MTRTAAVAAFAALAALAAIIAADLTAPVQAEPGGPVDDETAGRIVARRLADGRVEFGWQPRRTDGGWGSESLPAKRYFPTAATVGRWLRSSTVWVYGVPIGRINARLLSNGRIEFAFTPIYRERIEPRARYFPTDAIVGRWLRSTEITIGPALPRYTAVSAGGHHTCAIRGDRAIACWGLNDDGQTDAPAGSFTAVSAGAAHTCAIRESGEIKCWGANGAGQTDAPAGNFRAVSAGQDHTCAIRASGALECWGSNAHGQTDKPPGNYVAVSAGTAHTCAIRPVRGGTILKCWGSNAHGQTDTPAGSFTAVSAGATHTCAIHERPRFKLECWGANDNGQTDVPIGGAAPSYSAGAGYIAVSAGFEHTCALDIATPHASPIALCWGSNDEGQSNRPVSLAVPTAVSAGRAHTCGLRAYGNGAIECWGDNSFGQTDVPAN